MKGLGASLFGKMLRNSVGLGNGWYESRWELNSWDLGTSGDSVGISIEIKREQDPLDQSQ